MEPSLSEDLRRGCSLPSDLAMLVSFRDVYSPASSSLKALSCLVSLLSFKDSVDQQIGYV